MAARFILFVFIIWQWQRCVNSKCSSFVADSPTFSKTMDLGILVKYLGQQKIDCCMYGVDKILWSFSTNKSSNEWSPINYDRNNIFTADNRTLHIIECLEKHTGYYKCTGTNAMGQTLHGLSYLKVAASMSDYGIKIVNTSDSDVFEYQTGSDVTLFCESRMFMGTVPYFIWNRVMSDGSLQSIVNNGSLTTNRTNAQLIYGYKGFCQVMQSNDGIDLYFYTFSLRINSINISHQGQYSCFINELLNVTGVTLDMEDKRSFRIYIKINRNMAMHILLGIISCALITATLAYAFKYDIKIFMKNGMRILIFRNQSVGKYNFFFIYDFHDDNQFRSIHRVVTMIEYQGYSSYFHHRDQTYGKDTIEDLNTALRNSNLVVIWATTSLWKQAACCFCIDTLVNRLYRTKRVYIMNENKKKIMKHCTSRAVIADLSSCCTSKLFLLDVSTTLIDSKADIRNKWNSHQFIRWLISSLPIKYANNQDSMETGYINQCYQ